MPEERFTWKKQRERVPTGRWTPFRPEMVAERYRRQPTPTKGGTPWFPPVSPEEIARREEQRQFGEFGGTEAGAAWIGAEKERAERANLVSQINWLEETLYAEQGITPRIAVDTETASIEELQSYIMSLEKATGGLGGTTSAGGQQAGGQQFEDGFEDAIMRAEEMGINTTNARQILQEFTDPQNVDHIETRRMETYQLNLAIKAGRWEQSKIESGILAREFPEQYAKYEQKYQKGYTGATPFKDPRETFGQWFPRQPQYEGTLLEHQTKQFQEFPQLAPWYQEAGGRKTGKTFQEWQKGEPLAQAYLGAKREQEAIPREIQRPKWQPARR